MWPIVAACIDAGFTTLAPTLPGHGGDPSDLLGITWTDWVEAARDWEADVVVGQSMGADLALQLAAEHRCAGVVCINPLAPDPDALEGLQWRIERGQSWVEVGPSDVDEIAYERLPIEAVLTMTEGVGALDLGSITCPVLLVTSANDDVVDPASGEAIVAGLRGDVQRLRLRNSGHVATLGDERHLLQQATVEFVKELSGSTGSRLTRDR